MLLASTLVWLVAATGCSPTKIQIENELPEAVIENVRWTSLRSDRSFKTDEPERLEPGETSSEIEIWGEDNEGKEGLIHMEIVVGDTRVALVTEVAFRATHGETSTFTIRPDTPVSNPLLEDTEE